MRTFRWIKHYQYLFWKNNNNNNNNNKNKENKTKKEAREKILVEIFVS